MCSMVRRFGEVLVLSTEERLLVWLCLLLRDGSTVLSRLQMTQPTRGGAVTEVTNYRANCAESSQP